jgi:hypothetical protein
MEIVASAVVTIQVSAIVENPIPKTQPKSV